MNPRHIVAILLTAVVMPGVSGTVNRNLSLIPWPRQVEWLCDESVTPVGVRISVDQHSSVVRNREGYILTITPESISIDACDSTGVIWAQRTLEHLEMPDGSYPQVKITDYPEFPIRGFMYDDGRSFVGVERIKSFIDLISSYKLNVFHWHLADKPAWRIESRAYPRLNDGKFQRPGRDQGLFYTYDQIREVTGYAAKRGVMVIPEIDMPGHSDYFRTAFGVTMDSEEGKKILGKCIEEFCEEIPAELCPYLHIGSDEVRIKDQAGFMNWAQNLARSHGRTTLIWSPGLQGDSLTIRQLWRDGVIAAEGYPKGVKYVDSAMGYLNFIDPMLAPARYFFRPIGETGRYDGDCLGGIICLWNDVRVADKSKLAHHNGLAGGVLPFSERAWSGSVNERVEPVSVIPAADSRAMAEFEEFQSRMAAHKERRLSEELAYWSPLHASEWQVEIDADSLQASFTAYGDVLDLDALAAMHGISEKAPFSCKLTRKINSEADTIRYFKVGFEAPARSNRISDGIAAQGDWPNSGSVTVNGTALQPPVWNEPQTYRYHYNTWAQPEEELPYTDEQLYWMRVPLAVSLHKGENTVIMTLKRHFRGQICHAAFIEAAPK